MSDPPGHRPCPKTAKEFVGVLMAFFGDGSIPYSEREDVWHLLTALRGPDNIYRRKRKGEPAGTRLNGLVKDRKQAITARLRYAMVGYGLPGDYNPDPWPEEGIGLEKSIDSHHWFSHSEKAYRLLDELGLIKRQEGAKKP